MVNDIVQLFDALHEQHDVAGIDAGVGFDVEGFDVHVELVKQHVREFVDETFFIKTTYMDAGQECLLGVVFP